MSSSSTYNSFYDSDNIIAREHLHNFHNLPFHIYFTSPYSPLPPHLTSLNLNAFFRQIPAHSVPTPSSPPPQRLILIATEYHYRYIIDRRPTTQLSTHSSSDSLPPLVPIPQPINLTNSSSSNTQPPSYNSSDIPPAYQPPSIETLLERIIALRRSSIEFRNTTIDNRNLTISRLYADTDNQISAQQSHTDQEIRHCEELLHHYY